MTKTTCYFRLDRVWNIHVETTENSISTFLDFNIFWESNLPQEPPRGSLLWRSQYFPLLRNIRISIRTPLLKPQLRGWLAELQVLEPSFKLQLSTLWKFFFGFGVLIILGQEKQYAKKDCWQLDPLACYICIDLRSTECQWDRLLYEMSQQSDTGQSKAIQSSSVLVPCHHCFLNYVNLFPFWGLSFWIRKGSNWWTKRIKRKYEIPLPLSFHVICKKWAGIVSNSAWMPRRCDDIEWIMRE